MIDHERRELLHVGVTKLKHNWLFLNQLDSLAAVQRLVGFYLAQHNSVMPHSAFRGQTPEEIYSGTGDRVGDELAAARKVARAARIRTNKAMTCEQCPVLPTPVPTAPAPD